MAAEPPPPPSPIPALRGGVEGTGSPKQRGHGGGFTGFFLLSGAVEPLVGSWIWSLPKTPRMGREARELRVPFAILVRASRLRRPSHGGESSAWPGRPAEEAARNLLASSPARPATRSAGGTEPAAPASHPLPPSARTRGCREGPALLPNLRARESPRCSLGCCGWERSARLGGRSPGCPLGMGVSEVALAVLGQGDAVGQWGGTGT